MSEVTETTPLLGERLNDYSESDLQLRSQELVERVAGEQYNAILRSLESITVILSTLTLLLIISNYVIDNTPIGPIWYFTWYSEDAILSLATYMFFSILLSATTSLINIYATIIIIAEVTFSEGIIQAAVRLFKSIPWSLEDSSPAEDPWGPRHMAPAWVLFVKILMGTVSALAVTIGISYAVMFILRINGVLKIIFRNERFTSKLNGLLGSLTTTARVQQAGELVEHPVQEEDAETVSRVGQDVTSSRV